MMPQITILERVKLALTGGPEAARREDARVEALIQESEEARRKAMIASFRLVELTRRRKP